MKINHAIVHQMDKKQMEREVRLHLRQEEFVESDRVIALIGQIRDLYNTGSGRGYGEFDQDHFFVDQLRSFTKERSKFVEFTQRCMGDLSSRAGESNLATGGYVIFVNYEQNGSDYFMIAMLKSTPGVTFDRELEILSIEHLDLKKLHFAARIDLTAMAQDQDRYISFVKGRASEISSYFRAFIGVAEFTESRQNTRELVNMITDYCESVGLSAEETETVKGRVHAYCMQKSSAGERLQLEFLSSFIDEEKPTQFLEYANDRQITNDIDLDRKALRALVRYQGKDADVWIAFNSNALGKRVRFYPEDGSLVITPAPKSLLNQLTGE